MTNVMTNEILNEDQLDNVNGGILRYPPRLLQVADGNEDLKAFIPKIYPPFNGMIRS